MFITDISVYVSQSVTVNVFTLHAVVCSEENTVNCSLHIWVTILKKKANVKEALTLKLISNSKECVGFINTNKKPFSVEFISFYYY